MAILSGKKLVFRLEVILAKKKKKLILLTLASEENDLNEFFGTNNTSFFN